MAAAKGAAAPAAKRKRTRRAKRRTTDVGDVDSSSSSESEVGRNSAPAPVTKATRQAPVKSESSSSSSSSSSSDGEDQVSVPTHANGKPEKRRRKRTRKAKQPDAEVTSKGTTASTVPTVVNAKPIVAVDVSALKGLLDPSIDSRLSEATVAALTYAKQFALDRATWKFSKARQEHLIRHMLSRAPPPTAGEDATEPVTPTTDANEGEADMAAPALEASWWPDTWNGCVAYYLSTVQGGARARLLQRLQEAAQQEVPALPESPVQAAGEDKQPVAAANDASAPKTVSFADLAEQQPPNATANQATPSPLERERIVFERARARELLSAMGHAIEAK